MAYGFGLPGLVRGLIVGSLKNALAEAGHRASSTVSTAALGVFNRSANPPINPRLSQYTSRHISTLPPSASKLKEATYDFQNHSESDSLASSSEGTVDPHTGVIEDYLQFPLGAAKTQLHATYIVSQNKNSIIITDQHAAHERLVYERMKKALQNGGIKRQILLIPEIVDLEESKLARLLEQEIDLLKNDNNILSIFSDDIDVSDDNDDLFKVLIENKFDMLQLDLTFIKYISWAIPSIGFIGTVRGIGDALSRAAEAIDGNITGMTTSLGVAFNSTFVALVLSILLMLFITRLEYKQDALIISLRSKFLLK